MPLHDPMDDLAKAIAKQRRRRRSQRQKDRKAWEPYVTGKKPYWGYGGGNGPRHV